MRLCFFAFFLLTIFGVEVLSMDPLHDSTEIKSEKQECLTAKQECLTVKHALQCLNDVRPKRITLGQALACGVTIGTGSVPFLALSSTGIHYTCPDIDAYEAAEFICIMSISGVTFGIILGGAAILSPVAVWIYNGHVDRKNASIDEICDLIGEHEEDTPLTDDNFEKFTPWLLSANAETRQKIFKLLNFNQVVRLKFSPSSLQKLLEHKAFSAEAHELVEILLGDDELYKCGDVQHIEKTCLQARNDFQKTPPCEKPFTETNAAMK